MDLRHRHGDAAGEARDAQESLQRGGRDAERGTAGKRVCAGSRMIRRRAPPQRQHQRQYRQGAKDTDADMGHSPALARDEVLDHRRPDRAGHIVAGGGDRDRDAAPAGEPLRHVRHHRAEGRGGAEPDQHVSESEDPQAARIAGRHIAEAERGRRHDDRKHDAEAVRQPPHDDAAEREAHHGERVGQRGVRARDRELRLHGRQRDRHRPHADAPDGTEHHRGGQAQPGIGGVHAGSGRGLGSFNKFMPRRGGVGVTWLSRLVRGGF